MGRPRTALLDRERIAATALALVDEHGDFSVPQIAKRLGVQTASVYHHVEGRAGIVVLLRLRLAAEIDPGTLDLRPWDRALEAWALSYRAAFAAHPRAIPLLSMAQVAEPEVLAHYDKAVAVLLEAGFAESVVMVLIAALDNLVLGSALDQASPETMWEPAPDGSTPLLARALAALPEGRRADAAFDFALEGLLAHARRTLAGPPDGGPAGPGE